MSEEVYNTKTVPTSGMDNGLLMMCKRIHRGKNILKQFDISLSFTLSSHFFNWQLIVRRALAPLNGRKSSTVMDINNLRGTAYELPVTKNEAVANAQNHPRNIRSLMCLRLLWLLLQFEPERRS